MAPSRLKTFALWLPCAVALVLHSLWFNFVDDDAYISFVFSRNFAEHGQLVYNLGERVEGYTNFLWTLLLGILMKLGAPPEITSRLLGTAFGAATLYLVARLVGRVRDGGPDGPGASAPSSWLPAALLAASSSYAAWCSGGLETQLFTFLVVLGLVCTVEERLPWAGVVFALASLTRPEGLLVFGLVGVHRAAFALGKERRWRPTGGEWRAVALFLAIFAPYFAWRWWYYGWPLPNTFYVKTGAPPSEAFGRAMLSHGVFYVWQWVLQSRVLWGAPLALLAVWKHPRFGSLALLVVLVYLGYTVKVGGDFMGLQRFIMPVQVLTAVLVSLGFLALVDLVPARWRLPVGAGAAFVLVGAFVLTQVRLSRESLVPKADRGIDRPGYLALYAQDRGLIGKALAPHIRPDDFAIVGGAGVQTYYARLRAIDVFGLVSERVAHEVPPTRPRPGHQKWAPPSLVLELHPTLIFHCYDLHTDPSRYQLCGDAPYFRAHGYEPVTMHVPGLREKGEYYTFLKRKDRPWP